MDKNIYSTPEPTFAAELRSVLDKRNILTACTKRRVLDALDEHIVNDEDVKSATTRSKIIEEIHKSEETYIKHLEMLINEFKKPAEEQNLAPTTVINSVFGNIESIHNINCELLAQLKRSKGNTVSAFLTTAPFFKVYSVYAYNYRNIINILQVLPKSYPKFHEFITRQQCKPTFSKLESLLITPIQRIPRYILLLKELKNHTPENDSYYFELEKAIKEISSIADHIDNLVQEQENVSRMIAIQRCLVNGKPSIVVPGRKLIKEGAVVKVIKTNKGVLRRYLILFNDLILYCKDWKEADPLKCLKTLPLDKCSVSPMHHKRERFSLHCQSLSLTLGCSCANTANEWVNQISTSINQYIEDIRSLRRKSSVRQSTSLKRSSKAANMNKLLSCAPNRTVRKRKTEIENNIGQDDPLSSPSKKLRSSAEIQENQDKKNEHSSNENKSEQCNALVCSKQDCTTNCSIGTTKSCIKLAKKILVDASNSVQRYLTDSTTALLMSKCGGVPRNG